jgi:ankyrin repeat protein
MLTERGSNINIRNRSGDTPLITCVKNGGKENIRIIQKLMEMKADPSIVNNEGESFYSILSNEAEKINFVEDKV